MKKFFYLILTCLSYATFAQPAVDPVLSAPRKTVPASAVDVNGKITGIVKDSITQAPVEFANVALMDIKTNKPVDGTVCDDKGKFSIHKIAQGDYTLVISFIGFKNSVIPVQISEAKDQIDLGTVTISPTSEILKEVVVQGQRSLIEEKVDRTIYNAENDATTRGGDATDVLKRVPMLSVDLDGNVTLRGSQNIRVLINNKPSTIAASSVADALKQIPADQIKSVEVITSPSAKYDAEGSAGIINIITKKNNLQGVTLSLDAGAGLRGSNLGLNGNYRKKNMGFSLGGWGRANYNVNGSFKNTQTTTNGTEQLVNVQSADTRNAGAFGNYTLGWDYDINKTNSVTASVRYGLRNNNSYQDDLTTQRNNETPALADVKVQDLSNSVDASLNYTHLFKTPQREFSLLTLYSRNNRTNNYFNTAYLSNSNAIDSIRKNLNDSYNQEITVQADYQTPIGTTQMLEFGGKNIARKVSSDYKYFVAQSDGVFSPSAGQQPNVFDYTQNVTAGYLAYTLSFAKTYSLKAGARYEYTTIHADFKNTETNVSGIPSYGVLVPSVNVSKKLKNGNTLKASYNRRIQRPSIQFLNPGIQNSNNLNYTQGNPTLSPEYTNNYELSYSTFIKGSSLNFSGFMRNTNNSIQSVRDTLENGGILTTYRNIGQEDAYGMSIFANVNIGNKFSLNGGSDAYYAVLKNNVPDEKYRASNEGWVISYRIFGNYNLSKGWGFQFFGFYRGRQVQLQGTQGGFGIYSLGLKKDFNEKKGSIGFGAENFFTPAFKIKNETQSAFLSQNSTTTLHNMNFKVTFSYRIGKMSFDAPRRRSKSINNDDLKDGGGGGNDNNSGGGQQQQAPTQQGGGNRSGQGQQPRQGTTTTTQPAK